MDSFFRSAPLATEPDHDDARLFGAVGWMMSSWEWVEFRLSVLYSAFVGLPDGQALYQYGSASIFRERFNTLARAADAHFVAFCDQALEGEFNNLTADVADLANRRNDIAHGVVLDVTEFPYYTNVQVSRPGAKNFLLVPHLYAGLMRHGVVGPKYAYASTDIRRCINAAIEIEQAIKDFTLRIPTKREGR